MRNHHGIVTAGGWGGKMRDEGDSSVKLGREDVVSEILLEGHAFGPSADVVLRLFAVALCRVKEGVTHPWGK